MERIWKEATVAYWGTILEIKVNVIPNISGVPYYEFHCYQLATVL